MKPYVKIYGIVVVASAILGVLIAEQLYFTGILLIVSVILAIAIVSWK